MTSIIRVAFCDATDVIDTIGTALLASHYMMRDAPAADAIEDAV